MRNCEGVSHGRTNKNDRYSFLKRIQMWQCLRHFDAGMDMARYSAAVDRRCRPVPKSLEKIFEFGPGRTRIARKYIDRFNRLNIVFRFSQPFIMYFRRTQSAADTYIADKLWPVTHTDLSHHLCVNASVVDTVLICICSSYDSNNGAIRISMSLCESFDIFSFVSKLRAARRGQRLFVNTRRNLNRIPQFLVLVVRIDR